MHATDPFSIMPIIKHGLVPSSHLNEVVLNQTFSLVVEENARNNRNTVQMSILDPGLPDATNLRSDKSSLLIYEANVRSRNLGNLWVAPTNGQYATPEVVSVRESPVRFVLFWSRVFCET